jgi:hypothetical protein
LPPTIATVPPTAPCTLAMLKVSPSTSGRSAVWPVQSICSRVFVGCRRCQLATGASLTGVTLNVTLLAQHQSCRRVPPLNVAGVRKPLPFSACTPNAFAAMSAALTTLAAVTATTVQAQRPAAGRLSMRTLARPAGRRAGAKSAVLKATRVFRGGLLTFCYRAWCCHVDRQLLVVNCRPHRR